MARRNEIRNRRIPKIEIFPSKEGFEYGNCAMVAICSAFNLQKITFRLVCTLMKFKHYREGLSFFECKKLINFISGELRNESIYVSNIVGIEMWQLVTILNDKKLIVMFNEHLCYVEKGKIFDSYFTGEAIEDLLWKPTGWWTIR